MFYKIMQKAVFSHFSINKTVALISPITVCIGMLQNGGIGVCLYIGEANFAFPQTLYELEHEYVHVLPFRIIDSQEHVFC